MHQSEPPKPPKPNPGTPLRELSVSDRDFMWGIRHSGVAPRARTPRLSRSMLRLILLDSVGHLAPVARASWLVRRALAVLQAKRCQSGVPVDSVRVNNPTRNVYCLPRLAVAPVCEVHKRFEPDVRVPCRFPDTGRLPFSSGTRLWIPQTYRKHWNARNNIALPRNRKL